MQQDDIRGKLFQRWLECDWGYFVERSPSCLSDDDGLSFFLYFINGHRWVLGATVLPVFEEYKKNIFKVLFPIRKHFFSGNELYCFLTYVTEVF
jgi:hypothetical protein